MEYLIGAFGIVLGFALGITWVEHMMARARDSLRKAQAMLGEAQALLDEDLSAAEIERLYHILDIVHADAPDAYRDAVRRAKFEELSNE